MATVPNTIALENVPPSAEVASAPLRGNFATLQTTLNALIALLTAGTNGQALFSGGGATLNWAAIAAASGVGPGVVADYAGSSAPSGWLMCDGGAVDRTTYAALFAAIGTTYGVGDGATTFNLPDGRGRVTVGKGSNVAIDALGENDGVAEANRRPQHRHTAHSHGVGGYSNTPSSGGTGLAGGDRAGTSSTDSVDGGSGVATDALNAPAFIVFNKIIKT